RAVARSDGGVVFGARNRALFPQSGNAHQVFFCLLEVDAGLILFFVSEPGFEALEPRVRGGNRRLSGLDLLIARAVAPEAGKLGLCRPDTLLLLLVLRFEFRDVE